MWNCVPVRLKTYDNTTHGTNFRTDFLQKSALKGRTQRTMAGFGFSISMRLLHNRRGSRSAFYTRRCRKKQLWNSSESWGRGLSYLAWYRIRRCLSHPWADYPWSVSPQLEQCWCLKQVGVGNVPPRALYRSVYWHPLGCQAIELGKHPRGVIYIAWYTVYGTHMLLTFPGR